MLLDAPSVSALAAVVNAIYNQYSGLKKLNDQLIEQFDRAEDHHRKKFVSTINAAVGVSIADLLSEKRAKK